MYLNNNKHLHLPNKILVHIRKCLFHNFVDMPISSSDIMRRG